MFAYCGNNPVNSVDPYGYYYWEANNLSLENIQPHLPQNGQNYLILWEVRNPNVTLKSIGMVRMAGSLHGMIAHMEPVLIEVMELKMDIGMTK